MAFDESFVLPSPSPSQADGAVRDVPFLAIDSARQPCPVGHAAEVARGLTRRLDSLASRHMQRYHSGLERLRLACPVWLNAYAANRNRQTPASDSAAVEWTGGGDGDDEVGGIDLVGGEY